MSNRELIDSDPDKRWAVAAWFGGSYGTKKNLVLAGTTARRAV